MARRLKPFVGELVKAKGKVFERNGGHAIEIKEIHKLAASRTNETLGTTILFVDPNRS